MLLSIDKIRYGNQKEYTASEHPKYHEDESDLLNPEIWISDTRATMHSTAYDHGRLNLQEATAINDVVGVAGPPAKAKTIMDILSKICDGSGNAMQVTIRDVTHVPGRRYNLFSMTKMMLKG